jgi:hypothetical protein
MRGFWYVAVAVAVALPSAAGAQQVRAGAEFRANTTTAGIQRIPDVHVKSNGEFIVSWAGVASGGTPTRTMVPKGRRRRRYAL